MKKTAKILLLTIGVLCAYTTSMYAKTTHKKEVSAYYDYQVLPASFVWTTANLAIYENTVLVIRDNFTIPLTGGTLSTVTFPVGVTLRFEGGRISNGILNGNETKIEAPLEQIFTTSIQLEGKFMYDTFYPEWYGAGMEPSPDPDLTEINANDFAAMNATFQNANHVTLTQKYHMATNGSIVVDSLENFTLIGYGSLITNSTDTHIDAPIFDFRALQNLTIKGISFDGQMKMAKAITVKNVAAVTYRDITIKNLLNTNVGWNATGLEIQVNNGSVVHGDNIRISEIGGGQNGSINSGVGIGRAVFITLNYNPDGILSEEAIKAAAAKTKITFDNSVFEWVYGDDGDVIDIVDQLYISDAAHRFIFTNCTIRYASRRLVKGSASGIQYYNCKFDTASFEDLRSRMVNSDGTIIDPQPSGGVNFRNASPSTNPDFRNMYGKMINCEYRNSGNLTVGSGSVLILAYTDGVEIRGNRFEDMYVRLQNKTADTKIDHNSFFNANIEVNVPEADWESERSYITNNFGYYAPATSIHPALINVTNDLIAITIRGNKVFSNEVVPTDASPTNFFGLIRHVSNGRGKHVFVSDNEIIRTNNPSHRKELMISYQVWERSCKIFDNFNNQTGIGAGHKFTLGGVFNGASWNNRDGVGNPTN